MCAALRSCLLALAMLAPVPLAAQAREAAQVLPGGALWSVDMPAQWNGTLLLWSRGYSMRAGQPVSAPAEAKAALLARGYALAGSDYGSGRWSRPCRRSWQRSRPSPRAMAVPGG
jgi:hypothetical protein